MLKTIDHWFFDSLRTSWKGRGESCRINTVPTTWNGYGYQRCLRSLLSSSNWQPSDHTPLVRTSLLYNYALPSSPTCRWLRGSVNTSLSAKYHWPHGSDNVPVSSTRHNDMVSWHHIATQHSVRYRVDACSQSITRSLCRHCELVTPLGYTAYF